MDCDRTKMQSRLIYHFTKCTNIWIIEKNKMPLKFQNVPKLKINWICSPACLDQPVSSAFCMRLLFKNFLALSFFLLCGCISNIRIWELKDSYYGISNIFFTFLFTYKLSYFFFSSSVSGLPSDSYFELSAIWFSFYGSGSPAACQTLE